MSTRVKILNEARKLFNQKGFDRITPRQIAAKIGISDGNLRYHFRTKDDLAEALFNELVDTIGKELESGATGELNMKVMKDLLSAMLKNFYEYRFLVQDLVTFLKHHPRIRRTFNRITEERMRMLEIFISSFIREGYLVGDPYPGHYKKLMENMLIVTHFWINGSELFYHGPKKEIVAHYSDTIFSIMYPYLTSKGKQELAPIV